MAYTINDLGEMEIAAATEKASLILPLLQETDWALKAKALITLGRLANLETAAKLIDFIQTEKEPHWQLMALDSWYQMPLDCEKKAEVLQELLLWAKSPILIRGIISLSAYIGGKKVFLMLADFIDKPSHRLVKDEILAFAWFKTAFGLDAAIVEKLVLERLDLRVWLKHQSYDEKAVYGIYPNPDYLWQCARAAGLSRDEFKNLYWRARRKTSKPV
ncbi:MAG: hypothetical protein PHQ49_00680 [Clostridia bacterium]|nr:hypothetical protein [Clostridia bacterium]